MAAGAATPARYVNDATICVNEIKMLQVLTLVQCSTAPVLVTCEAGPETSLADSYTRDSSLAQTVLQYIQTEHARHGRSMPEM